jgi:hypothetical protein
MMSSGVFSRWQPAYAERGIPTFPVTADKIPATKGYLQTGLRGSAQLAEKFPQASAFGLACGSRTGIAVLDIDSKDERILADAIDRHGETPVVVRSGSGNHQAWYKHNGEGRQIRPEPDLPIDILGAGFVVAPPSKVTKGIYQFVQGGLDDLDRLPVLRDAPTIAINQDVPIGQGTRNKRLFQHCLREARHCDEFDALLDVARTFNLSCVPPLTDSEVIKTAQSIWKMQIEGRIWAGRHMVVFDSNDVNRLIRNDPDAFQLLSFLRANNGPDSTFMATNTLAETFRWRRKRLANARSRLIAERYFKPVRQAGKGTPALYRWAKG